MRVQEQEAGIIDIYIIDTLTYSTKVDFSIPGSYTSFWIDLLDMAIINYVSTAIINYVSTAIIDYVSTSIINYVIYILYKFVYS